MKEQVLGPSYASLITTARKYIPHCDNDSGGIYFSSNEFATVALDWYHNLFPNPAADPKWRILAVAVYQCLKETPMLPVVFQSCGTVATEKDKQRECGSRESPEARFLPKGKSTASSTGSFRNASSKYSYHEPRFRDSARESNYEHARTARHATVYERRRETLTRLRVEWLPPNIVYFTSEKQRERQSLLDALLRIRMPVLLYTPLKIHKALLESEVESRLLSSKNVIKFLLTSQDENSRCNIGKLPVQLNSSNFQNKSNLRSILAYCKKALKKFPEYIQGLPLLLTDDNMLRAFTSESPVYCSIFRDLFPDKAFKFIHPKFVSLLSTCCGLEPDIIRDLTIQSLATEFMPDVFNGKLELGERKHVPWKYPKKGVLSEKWLSRLWKFLSKDDNSTNESSSLVTWLGKYPIIPTTDGKLATVGYAKTVLVVTDDKKGDYLQEEVTEILKSLDCPFLDELITKDALSVVRRLVADPHCVSDALHVLDYMNSTGTLDMNKFDENKINTLLRFIQADCKNDKSMNIAKTFPFYRGVDGGYHSLSSYNSYIVVPAGLPDNGIKELQHMHENNILFLPRASDLDRMYKALGIIVDCGISEFYISYVLPNFSSFSRQCQIEFLTIAKSILHYMSEELKQKLRSTRCIPDQSGNLRVASSYFNPHNVLFRVMFKPKDNVFPVAPFNQKEWIDFLVEIGLKKNCDEQQFITFARGVEESARRMSKYDLNIITQSKALVKYLLENGRNWFHVTISDIEFIVPEEVEDELSSLHPQYRVNGKLEFVSYRASVPWKDRHLVWTSTKLLPDWAYPQFDRRLGIPSKPLLYSVIDHVKIISNCASEIVMTDRTLPEKIIEVFKNVYDFLKEMMQNCKEEPPFANCNEECRKIGKCLTNVACILLSKERCLVKGEGLSFEDTKEKLKPHFHMVPWEYGVYDHLLKRLGVTGKITPSQMANVLKSLKDSSTKDTMNSEEEKKACYATSVLFESLHGNSTEVGDSTEGESKLSSCKELNLPSMKKRLVKSSKLVCNVQPRLRESVEKQGYEILYPLEKCGLKRELEDAYLNALPKRLRPTPFSSLVREEIDPFCKKNMTCFYCTKMDCPFIQKFILVLRSSQFEHGILRLLKHQKETLTLDDEDRARAARFTSTKVRRILWCKISILFGLLGFLGQFRY
jgi:sacsin